MNVADLAPEGCDSLGAKIACIYARKPPDYAVYRTSARVLVHFADNEARSAEQRKTLAQLAPIRGEINGLIDGWRSAPNSIRLLIFKISNGARLRAKAERYDRRVADAVQVGLEGDLPGAAALLAQVKQDILDERIAWSRFEYLVVAFVTVVAIGLLSELAMILGASSPCARHQQHFLCVDEAINLWRGFAGGSVGAFFSIALGIRGRTILTDLYRTSNVMDAILRVLVGAIGGVVLVSLALAHFVRFRLGDTATAAETPLEIFIVSFIAGFAERLVPDLLAKADTAAGDGPPARKASPAAAAAQPPVIAAGGGGGQAAPAAAAAEQAEPLAPDEAGEDACVADEPIAPDEVTDDEDLPAASGGVATDEPAT